MIVSLIQGFSSPSGVTRVHMTLAVDWDVRPQYNQQSGVRGTSICFTGCMYSGMNHSHGDMFTSGDGCFTCTCQHGCVECETRICG